MSISLRLAFYPAAKCKEIARPLYKPKCYYCTHIQEPYCHHCFRSSLHTMATLVWSATIVRNLLPPLIITITRVEVARWEQPWSGAETKWEAFAGSGLPSACCQPVALNQTSRSQSHADVQLTLSRSSQALAQKEDSGRKYCKKSKSMLFFLRQGNAHWKSNPMPSCFVLNLKLAGILDFYWSN